jgi:hypothetical protein
MSKALKLSIPGKCHENWDSMFAQQDGRFCGSCQKTVIDFTQMTDQQLVNFFQNKKENVCGRLFRHQLDKELDIPVKKIHFLKYFFQFTLPPLLFSLKASAQNKHFLPKIKTESVPYKKVLINEEENTPRIILGVVKDSNSNVIPFATVMETGTRNFVVSDQNGKFSITLTNKIYSVSATTYGYFETRLSVPKGKDSIAIILKRNFEMMTEVVVGGLVSTRYRKKKKIKPVVEAAAKNDTIISIYPNPAKIGSSLTIKWNNPVKDNQHIEIYDVSGKLVQSEIKHIADKSSLEKINLNLYHAGTYVVRITNSKNNKSQSLSFIAE